MNFIDRAKILIQAKIHEKETKDLFALSRAQNIAKWAAIANVSPYVSSYPMRPDYPSFLDKYKHNIETTNSGTDTIAFGDSLLDFTRDQLTAIKEKFNFAVAGFGSPNMLQMAVDLDLTLGDNMIKNQVKYVILGCLAGNPLLSHQDLEYAKIEARNAFIKIRSLYPTAKFIVYGLPPVYDLYVNLCAPQFESYMIDLIMKDGNATYLLLQKKFAGAFGIFPKIDYSKDTVHFNGNGIIRFDKLLNEAKTSTAKLIA